MNIHSMCHKYMENSDYWRHIFHFIPLSFLSFSLPVSTWVGSDFGWMSADMDTTGVVVPFCFPSTHVFRIYLSFLRSAFGSRQYFNDHDRAQVNVFFISAFPAKTGPFIVIAYFAFHASNHGYGRSGKYVPVTKWDRDTLLVSGR